MRRVKRILIVCAAIAFSYIALASANLPLPLPSPLSADQDRQSPYNPTSSGQADPLGSYTYTEVDEPEPEEPGEPLLLYRTIENLRLREEPSTEAEVIETILQGTLVQVTDQWNEDWYFVYVDGMYGYMSTEFLAFVALRPPGSPMYMAGSVTVMDAQTGAVLFESEQHTTRYPASVTKIMTALLVLEHVDDLSELITFSETAVAIPWYASRMGMQAGDTMTVYDALYALMLVSANEVAWALAEHVSDSFDEFVDQMNLRAASLGAVNTRFANPCGLPGEGQYTTSYDMALIMRAAMQNPVFNRIIATPSADLPPTESHDTPRSMRNTNRLIHPDGPEFNNRVIGGKTGFTNAAQHTLVTYAELDGRAVIVSVLYVPHRGAIFSDTSALLEHVHSNS